MFQLLIRAQDDQLDMIGSSVGVLKTMSQHIGNELEDQNAWVLLDPFDCYFQKICFTIDDCDVPVLKR